MKKKILSLTLALTMAASLAACGSSTASQEGSTTTDTTKETESTTEAAADGKVYKIGVCQLVQHDALDASYNGFIDGLKEAGFEEGKNLQIDYQNAQGEQANCATIASKLVNNQSDLILAIATPAAQACANATSDIPIVVTAVTDPAESGLVKSNESTETNVTGTSDLNPISDQMDLLVKLVPDAKTVAVLYNSSETNSKIQADLAKEAGEKLGLEVIDATISNSNEIQQVVQSLVGKVNAIYAPTDNLIAAGMATVAMVANENKIPVICGESGMVEAGGLATYGIDYYELGKLTGAQAAKILNGEAQPSEMPIEYLDASKLQFSINKEVAEQIGVEIPADLEAN
ncbi:ABC transporter substrate-binding protein [Konateibacter massiliensis]|uniref:ABC transporter substrate-binding protein n=1 Tax=Konateibacter massiliensis TaxID=2002841 RepID=UPI000C15DBBF|nr:ABC transporter substrate-binding protein [Konateibacter massiliensis]